MSLYVPDLSNRVAKVLKELGLSDDQIKGCLEYLEGKGSDKKLFGKLPKLDMEQLTYAVRETVGKTYQSLREKDKNYTKKYLKLLFALGQKSLLKIIYVHMGYSRDKVIKELMQFDAPIPYGVAWLAEDAINHTVNPAYIASFETIYRENEDHLVQGWKLSDINAQVFLAAFLVAKGPKAYLDLKKWLEQVLLNSIASLFKEPERNRSQIEAMAKYVKGGLFVKDSMLAEIKQGIAAAEIDSYTIHLLSFASYSIRDVSTVGKRLLKLLMYNFHTEVLNFLNLPAMAGHTDEKILNLKALALESGVLKEYYIAWLAARALEQGKLGFLLAVEIKEDSQSFARAISLTEGWTSLFLSKCLWVQGMGQEYLPDAEETYIEFVAGVLADNNAPQPLINDCKACFRGEKEFSSIQGGLRKILEDYNLYQLKYCVWFNGVSPMFPRTLSFMCAAGCFGTVGSNIYPEFIKDKGLGLAEFLSFLEEAGVEKHTILAFLTHWAVTDVWGNQKKLSNDAKGEIKSLLIRSAAEVIPGIASCNAEGRAYLLEELFKLDRQKYAPLLIEYMEDSAKGVREKVIQLLGGYQEAFEQVLPCLSAKKQAVRECAVHILSIWNDERSKEALATAMEAEKSDKVRGVLKNVLAAPGKAAGEEPGDINIIDYCDRELKRTRGGSIGWLSPETLPTVRFEGSEEQAGESVIKYILVTWATAVLSFTDLHRSPVQAEIKKVAAYLNRRDLAELALEAFNRWIETGAEAKKKWVLPMASTLGDDRVISLFKKKIEEWPQQSRGAIACDAVRALALSGQDIALMTIDSVARKFKFRQVKETAAQVMGNLAEQLNVDPEELSDRIVPDLGFNQRGEQTLDFGPRVFIARLTQSLGLEIYDQGGKKYKSLPAPGKNDDEAKAKQAGDLFKGIKKQLKSVITIQAVRLEGALATNRKWTKEMWERVFVQNPIMQQFATALIWGAYLEGSLLKTFRYLEDGTFNTLEEEEYQIPAGALIGLVHPIELENEEIANWQGQLEDYEVTQPFEQLSRPVFRVNEAEKSAKYVDRFGGMTINCLSLMGKLTKFGWYRGSVLDGGGYYNFYKEEKGSGLGAELSFSGVGIGIEDEEVTLYALKFYRAGTIERGSYVYSEITDEKLVKPKDVPGRFFSEILLEVDKATTAKLGVNPDWKREAGLTEKEK